RTAGGRWRTMDSGHSTGKRYGTMTGTPGHPMEARVVAVDRQDNTGASTPVEIAVPLDDAASSLRHDFSGDAGLTSDGNDWTAITDATVASPQDYMGTLHLSAVPEGRISYRFPGPSDAVLVFDSADPYVGTAQV